MDIPFIKIKKRKTKHSEKVKFRCIYFFQKQKMKKLMLQAWFITCILLV